jgi:hypothetical protein
MLSGTAFGEPVKVLFFEAALAPTDMIFSNEPAGYSQLAQLLRGEDMLIASMSTGEITREKLMPYEIVVLHCSPERPLHNKEVSALVWFVAQEGGILFVNGGDSRIVNPLTEIFGVSMDASNLIDSSSAMEGDSTGRKFTLTNFSKNAEFKDDEIKTIGFYGGSALVLSEDAAPIVSGDEDCYSEDGFYSIDSFPPVAAVAYLGPGVVVVKSDRAMMNNENIQQYQNEQWAQMIFTHLAAAHENALKRDESILGLQARVGNLEKMLLNSSEKIKKHEADLELGYKKMQDLQTNLQAVKDNNEDLSGQLAAVQAERDKLNRSLSWYRSADVRKMAAVISAGSILVVFLLGLMAGRRSARPKE